VPPRSGWWASSPISRSMRPAPVWRAPVGKSCWASYSPARRSTTPRPRERGLLAALLPIGCSQTKTPPGKTGAKAVVNTLVGTCLTSMPDGAEPGSAKNLRAIDRQRAFMRCNASRGHRKRAAACASSEKPRSTPAHSAVPWRAAWRRCAPRWHRNPQRATPDAVFCAPVRLRSADARRHRVESNPASIRGLDLSEAGGLAASMGSQGVCRRRIDSDDAARGASIAFAAPSGRDPAPGCSSAAMCRLRG
jgi:hypothetical protein